MTDLILSIYEASYNNEIDDTTRDLMLGIIKESSVDELTAKIDEKKNKLKSIETMLFNMSNSVGSLKDDVRLSSANNKMLKKGTHVGVINTKKGDSSNMTPRDFAKTKKTYEDIKKDIKKLEKQLDKAKKKDKSAKIVKESVIEKAMLGEITPDEQKFLLEYLESKI